MAATERDGDYERWQSALTALQEVSAQYHALVRLIQNGLSTLSLENDALRAEVLHLRREVRTMDETFQQLLPSMATIAAYVVSQQRQQAPPQGKPRQQRRANGE